MWSEASHDTKSDTVAFYAGLGTRARLRQQIADIIKSQICLWGGAAKRATPAGHAVCPDCGRLSMPKRAACAHAWRRDREIVTVTAIVQRRCATALIKGVSIKVDVCCTCNGVSVVRP